MAKARWIARASVSLKTAKLKMKGSGDAYQSWNRDQASAAPRMISVATRPGLRPPVSADETSSSICAWVMPP